MTDEEFEDFVHTAVHDLQDKQDVLMESHGLGRYTRYWFDQEQASLDFSDAAGVTGLRALVVPVGSWSPKSQTWKWAWSNSSIVAHLREKSAILRELAEETGREVFDRELFETDEQMAWQLTAIAVRHLSAIGAYRAPGENGSLFLAITAIREVGKEGWTS